MIAIRLVIAHFSELAHLPSCVLAVLLMSIGQPASWGAQPPHTAKPGSQAIRINTIGYRPDAPKQATVAVQGEEFLIRDSQSGAEVLRGRLSEFDPPASGDDQLFLADFTALDREGHYRIEIEDAEPSCEFRVSNDVYNWPFYCSLRAMYLWRCGCEVSGDFAGRTYRHAACHTDDAFLDHVGGPHGHRKVSTGGWHDAGDYNKYTVNGAFTAGMMLQAWEHFGERLAPLNLDIPESGNSVPDFLDEVRWELEWLLTMQADDGRVYHKLSTLKFGDFILPEEETARRYFSPWSSAATADLAAVLAQAARVYRSIDDEFANRCLEAAEKSYAYLESHPQNRRPDLSKFVTGPYDAADKDDRLWAAAELWETTGGAKYLRDLERRLMEPVNGQESPAEIVDSDWDWGNLRNLGVFTYLLSKRPDRNPTVVDKVRHEALRTAASIVETARRNPYGRTLGSTHYWGCNGTVARQTINLNVAHRLTGDPRYHGAMRDAIHHLFGRNPFGRSYVTGLGHRPPMFPHDRRSGGDDLDAPWPGYLVGGPWPKPTDWYDVQKDYRTNEVAINWNGALIYALAAFVEPDVFDDSIAEAKRSAAVAAGIVSEP